MQLTKRTTHWRPLAAAMAVLTLLAACGGKPPASSQAAPAQHSASPALTPVPSHGPGAATHKTPARIVSLVPAVTEMLYAIGAGPRMAGVSSFDNYPPEVKSLPKLRKEGEKNQEMITIFQTEVTRLFGVIDRILADGRQYLAGDYSIGDIMHYPWLRFPLNLKFPELIKLPRVVAWLERIGERPAVKRGMEIPKV